MMNKKLSQNLLENTLMLFNYYYIIAHIDSEI